MTLLTSCFDLLLSLTFPDCGADGAMLFAAVLALLGSMVHAASCFGPLLLIVILVFVHQGL